MAVLRLLRHIIGIPWIGATIWGIVSAFQGNWGAVGIAVVVWLVLGIFFSFVHSTLVRVEAGTALNQMLEISDAIDFGQWVTAVEISDRQVRMLRTAASRDRSSIGANGQSLAPVLGIALLSHGTLLGATGRLDSGRSTLAQAVSILSRSQSVPLEVQLLVALARELQGPCSTVSDFQHAARRVHAAV